MRLNISNSCQLLKSAERYARNLGIHGIMKMGMFSIKRTTCFTNLFISTVFSCPFSSTAIAEDDKKNPKDGSRVLGMSSENRFVFV